MAASSRQGGVDGDQWSLADTGRIDRSRVRPRQEGVQLMGIVCPNEFCDDEVEEHVNSSGGGSRYCSRCGYYEEVAKGTLKVPSRTTLTPKPPAKKPPGRSRR